MSAKGVDCTVCVSFISHREETPTTTGKSMLLQAGLGCKKIKLLADDTEEEVLNKLTSDAKDEFGNTLGFPQLRACSGFEMLQCAANCRDICHWHFVVWKCVELRDCCNYFLLFHILPNVLSCEIGFTLSAVNFLCYFKALVFVDALFTMP